MFAEIERDYLKETHLLLNSSNIIYIKFKHSVRSQIIKLYQLGSRQIAHPGHHLAPLMSDFLNILRIKSGETFSRARASHVHTSGYKVFLIRV